MQNSRLCEHVTRITALRLFPVCIALLLLSAAMTAQGGGGGNGNNNPIAFLKGVAAPQPADLGRYAANSQTLVVLGKALFWDVQVGSDGRTACATCHFHAGAADFQKYGDLRSRTARRSARREEREIPRGFEVNEALA